MESSRVFHQKPLKASSTERFSRRKLPSQQRLREEVVDRQLKVIYQDRHGGKRDLTRFDRDRGFSWIRGFGIVVLLAVIGVGGWKVYETLSTGATRFGDNQVELSIDAPKTIAVGQKTTITITAVNRSLLKLNDLDLLLQYPKEWEYLNATSLPEGTEQRRWKLNSLDPGGSATIGLEGRFWSPLPANFEVHASLVYTPESLRASFRSAASATISAAPSLIVATVKSPDRLNLGQKEEWSIDVTSKASEPLSTLSVEVLMPSQFLLDSTSPTVDARSGLSWKGLTIEPEKSTTLKFSGTFVDTSGAGGDGQPASKQFTVRLLHGEQLPPQLVSEQTVSAVVIQSAFSLRLTVNGALTRSDTLPATSVPVKIEVVNRGADPVSDVQLGLKLQSNDQVADIIAMDAIESKYTPMISGTTLHWDKKSVDALAFIRGGDTAVVTVNLPLRAQALGSIDLSASASYPKANESMTAESNSVTLSVASPITLTANGRYYDDDNLALGNGPLPPRVGTKTTFALFFSVTKKTSSYKSVEISYTIPNGVEVVRVQAPVGLITSDRVSHTIRWNIDSMPENITSLTADARVSITPTVNDVGNVLPLLTGATVKAQDVKTFTVITQTTPLPVTTNIDGDPQVSGRGTVVSE